MKKLIPLSFLLYLSFCACNNDDRQASDKSENDVDAARNFIQAALNGDFKKARTYMLRDQTNKERMDAIERVSRTKEEQEGLAGASIMIHNVRKVNDTSTIVIYSNSFRNDWDTLRVIKENGDWLVDFDYYFTHDSDTLSAPALIIKDSMPQ